MEPQVYNEGGYPPFTSYFSGVGGASLPCSWHKSVQPNAYKSTPHLEENDNPTPIT